MSPDRLRACLALLHWSQRGLADILDTHPTTVRRWATGEGTIPISVGNWLEGLARAHTAAPLPAGWEQRVSA